MLYSGPMERSVRGSTKAKTQTTEEADKIRAQHQERVKAKFSLERPVKTAFKQKDLLMEALDTEVTTLLSTATATPAVAAMFGCILPFYHCDYRAARYCLCLPSPSFINTFHSLITSSHVVYFHRRPMRSGW
jgi:hypothetical protein